MESDPNLRRAAERRRHPSVSTIAADRAREQAVEREATAGRAREAFRLGTEAGEAGRHEEAVRHLDRAHRLARGDHTIGFALALARLRVGDPAGAIAPLLSIARALDLRQAAIALAIARRRQGLSQSAAHHLADTLSRQALDRSDPSFVPIADAIAAEAGFDGWCGLDATGVLTVRSVGQTFSCAIRLDGAPFGPARLAVEPGRPVSLPAGADWRRRRRLTVEAAGARLLAGLIDVASIARTDGIVDADREGGLSGWAWCPNAPEHDPVLTLADAGGNRLLVVRCSTAIDAAIPDRRFGTVARGFRLPAADCPSGPLRVFDETGLELPGSPIEPGLERDAIAASLRDDPASARLARRFAPVPADFRGRPASRGPVRRAPPVAIVIPVHRGLRRTIACLDAVSATVPPGTAVHVVDDGSPDPELAATLDTLARSGRIRLHRHEGGRNLGFPASVNRGIAAAAPCDVVLLNSDTIPVGEWLSRLRRAARSAADIASATPFTSEGSILAFPRPGQANRMPDPDQSATLGRLAARVNHGERAEIPVGVGFCLYLRRDAIEAVGPFRDDLFGRGYGEENDWCLRARHLGWRHVAALDAYVAHEGGVSFGAGGRALMRRNQAILNRLHPGYDALVAAFAAADPLAGARRRLDEALIAEHAARETVLFVTHAAGGGVERVVRARTERARRGGARALVLRPDPEGLRNDLAVLQDQADPDAHPNLRYALPAERGALEALLRTLGPARIEIHHLLNHHDAVPDLCRALAVPVTVHVHDYAAFCHRIALFGPERRYCGEPDRDGCRRCVAEQGSLLDEAADVDALLARSALLLGSADLVVVPSADVARRIARHFPALEPAAVEPWEDEPAHVPAPRRRRRSPSAPVHVVVPGGLGPEKGCELLLACARDALARRLALRFSVVGYSSIDDRLQALGVAITGPYDGDEVGRMLEAADADLAFLPSLWPETWSFVLTECWQAGIPVVAFDIGTPAERIRARGAGTLLALDLPPTAVNDALLAAVAERFVRETVLHDA